jgi:hypothetical protein
VPACRHAGDHGADDLVEGRNAIGHAAGHSLLNAEHAALAEIVLDLGLRDLAAAGDSLDESGGCVVDARLHVCARLFRQRRERMRLIFFRDCSERTIVTLMPASSSALL